MLLLVCCCPGVTWSGWSLQPPDGLGTGLAWLGCIVRFSELCRSSWSLLCGVCFVGSTWSGTPTVLAIEVVPSWNEGAVEDVRHHLHRRANHGVCPPHTFVLCQTVHLEGEDHIGISCEWESLVPIGVPSLHTPERSVSLRPTAGRHLLSG